MAAVRQFVARRYEVSGGVELGARALRGGLEAQGVQRVTARFRDRRAKRHTFGFVVKHLRGPATREARIYADLVARAVPAAAPEVFETEWIGDDECRLYMEAVRPVRGWPWGDVDQAGDVLSEMVSLHADPPDVELPPWDYEAELLHCGGVLLDVLGRLDTRGELATIRRVRPAVARLVEALPDIRRELQDEKPFGRTLIHGDLHPGNAAVRRRRARERPVLFDWGRAREGAALEDVASWLHTLSLWEPEARRRHDSLLGRYLSERGWSGFIGRDVRDACWLAAACNILAGAVLYHIGVVTEGKGRQRHDSFQALDQCARILRRADACWRN